MRTLLLAAIVAAALVMGLALAVSAAPSSAGGTTPEVTSTLSLRGEITGTSTVTGRTVSETVTYAGTPPIQVTHVRQNGSAPVVTGTAPNPAHPIAVVVETAWQYSGDAVLMAIDDYPIVAARNYRWGQSRPATAIGLPALPKPGSGITFTFTINGLLNSTEDVQGSAVETTLGYDTGESVKVTVADSAGTSSIVKNGEIPADGIVINAVESTNVGYVSGDYTVVVGRTGKALTGYKVPGLDTKVDLHLPSTGGRPGEQQVLPSTAPRPVWGDCGANR